MVYWMEAPPMPIRVTVMSPSSSHVTLHISRSRRRNLTANIFAPTYSVQYARPKSKSTEKNRLRDFRKIIFGTNSKRTDGLTFQSSTVCPNATVDPSFPVRDLVDKYSALEKHKREQRAQAKLQKERERRKAEEENQAQSSCVFLCPLPLFE